MTKFISVVSGKGGTGKTTVAINLALALNEFGHSVILLDSDLKSADIGLLLGIPPQLNTVHDVLTGKKDISEVIYRHPSGLNLIPASISVQTVNLVSNLDSVISNLNGSAEIVIMDSPAGFHKEVFSLLSSSDEVLIVTNPELPAVTDAIRAAALVEGLRKKISGIVVNRYQGNDSEMSIENISTMLSKEILEVVPEDTYIRKSVKLKYPVSYAYPLAPSSVSFKRLAAKLLGKY